MIKGREQSIKRPALVCGGKEGEKSAGHRESEPFIMMLFPLGSVVICRTREAHRGASIITIFDMAFATTKPGI